MAAWIFVLFALVLIVLVSLSAMFSFSEMAISSSNKTRLLSIIDESGKSNRKTKQAQRALHFVENYNEHVTAIVIFNNIVNILFSTLATVFFILVAKEINPSNAETLGPIMSFVITTPIVIIFGEIVPKQLAKKYAESGTMLLSTTIFLVSGAMKPFTIILGKIIKEEDNTALSSDDEINIAIAQAREAGVTTSFEENLIRKLLAADNLTVQEIMVPKEDVVTIPFDITPAKLNNFLKNQFHTRFPMTGKDGEPVSVFSSRNYLIDKLKNDVKPLKEYQFKFTTFGLDENPYHILEALRNRREKLAIIIDDDDKFIGIVTLEDVLEILVGEIYDEGDVEEDGVYSLNETSFILNNGVLLDYWVTEYAKGVKLPSDIKEMEIQDWVKSNFDDIPEHGDSFTYKNLIIWVRKDKYDSKKLVYEIDII